MQKVIFIFLFGFFVAFSASAQTTHYAYSLIKDASSGAYSSYHRGGKFALSGFTYWVSEAQSNNVFTLWKSDSLGNTRAIVVAQQPGSSELTLLGIVNGKVLVQSLGYIWRIDNDVLVRVAATQNLYVSQSFGVSDGYLYFLNNRAIYRYDGFILEQVTANAPYGSAPIVFVKPLN